MKQGPQARIINKCSYSKQLVNPEPPKRDRCKTHYDLNMLTRIMRQQSQTI
jgi:hypothetical protein